MSMRRNRDECRTNHSHRTFSILSRDHRKSTEGFERSNVMTTFGHYLWAALVFVLFLNVVDMIDSRAATLMAVSLLALIAMMNRQAVVNAITGKGIKNG